MKKLGIIFGMTFLLSLGSFSIADAACVAVITSCGAGGAACGETTTELAEVAWELDQILCE